MTNYICYENGTKKVASAGISEGEIPHFEGYTTLPVPDNVDPSSLLGTIYDSDTNSLKKFELALDELKSEKWNTVKEYKQYILSQGCNTTFGVVDIDDASVSRINLSTIAAKIALDNGEHTYTVWTLKDNTSVTLNEKDTVSMGCQVAAFLHFCQGVSESLRDKIEQSSSPNELKAIDITAGYSAPILEN